MELDPRNLHLVDHVTAQLKVYIQPAYAKQVELGVKKELDTHVLRFMEDQQAVLLGYRNVQVVSKQALLTAYMPYLTIECTAELLLFKPNIGNVLVGRVHSLSPGQLNVLVLGGINAAVTEEELPEGFRFDVDHNCWVRHGDYSRAILMGDVVACKVLSAPVTDIDEEQLLFNLDASLLSKSTGLLQQQPPLQQQRRAQLQAAVAAAAAKAAKKEAKKLAAAAAAQAAGQEDAAAAKAAKPEKKAGKRTQQEQEPAEQPPAKRQKQSQQQQQQQQPGQRQPPQPVQLLQAGKSGAAGSSSSSESPTQGKQKSVTKSSKQKHKDKDKDRSGGKLKHKDKVKDGKKSSGQ